MTHGTEGPQQRGPQGWVANRAGEYFIQNAVFTVFGLSGLAILAVFGWYAEGGLVRTLGGVPVGGVMAFDLEKGCPEGWTDLGLQEPERFAGRVVVAAGPREDRAEGPTVKRSFGDAGGSEHVAIEANALPTVVVPDDKTAPPGAAAIDAGWQEVEHGSGGLTPAGEDGADEDGVEVAGAEAIRVGERLPSMPPFLVLHLCRRAGG